MGSPKVQSDPNYIKFRTREYWRDLPRGTTIWWLRQGPKGEPYYVQHSNGYKDGRRVCYLVCPDETNRQKALRKGYGYENTASSGKQINTTEINKIVSYCRFPRRQRGFRGVRRLIPNQKMPKRFPKLVTYEQLQKEILVHSL